MATNNGSNDTLDKAFKQLKEDLGSSAREVKVEAVRVLATTLGKAAIMETGMKMMLNPDAGVQKPAMTVALAEKTVGASADLFKSLLKGAASGVGGLVSGGHGHAGDPQHGVSAGASAQGQSGQVR